MSLFGTLMGDFEDDPFFGAHMQSMQQMNNMMNSMFANPFGMMGAPAIMGPQAQAGQMPGMQMMPFGFPSMPMNIGRMFSDLGNMNPNPNCHSFTSSSVMTMTSGPDGRPQVYQESMSTRTGPGGVKETKQTVNDSRTGLQKMAIGHHIGDRAHIIEREKNVRTGDQEERQDFINLDEEEAEQFNYEWESKTKRTMGAIGNGPYRSGYNRAPDNRQLALPSTVPRSAESSSSNSCNNSASNPSHSTPVRPTAATAPAAAAAAVVVPPSDSPQNLSTSRSNSNNNSNSNINHNNSSHSNSSSCSNSHNNNTSGEQQQQRHSSTPSGRKRERSPDSGDDECSEIVAVGSNKRRSHGSGVED